MSKNQIFLSYSSKNAFQAQQIQKHLERQFFDVWRDQDRLSASIGDPFPEVLATQVKESVALIACLSPDYVASEWCMREANLALAENKLIYPVLVAPFPEKQNFPPPFDTHQFIDITGRSADFSAIMGTLIKNMRADKIVRKRSVYAVRGGVLAVLAIIVGIVIALLLPGKSVSPPNGRDFRPVTGTDGKHVIALDGYDDLLWFIVQDPDSNEKELFWLDGSQGNTAQPTRVGTLEYTEDEQVVADMEADCAGYVWISIYNIGVIVFDQAGNQPLGVLDKTIWLDTWGQNLTTIYGIESRCVGEPDDQTVEVWFGREGVHSLTYPVSDITAYALRPAADDAVFRKTQAIKNDSGEIAQVDAMALAGNILWIKQATDPLTILAVNVDNTTQSARFDDFKSSAFFQSVTSAVDGGAWISIDISLEKYQVDADTAVEVVSLPVAITGKSLAEGNGWVWIGNTCAAGGQSRLTDCTALIVMADGALHTVEDLDIDDTNAILVDENGVWLATDSGLLVK